MGGDLLSIFLLSLVAMFNPTLLAAVTILMLLPNTKRLMLGYLLGAYTTSITLGLLIVFSLSDSGSVETAKQTLGPVEDVVLGVLALAVAYALGGGRTESMRERRRQRKEEKQRESGPKQSWPERMLGRGSARVTFAVGIVLSFPGVSYLTALDRIAGLDAADAVTACSSSPSAWRSSCCSRSRCSATPSRPSGPSAPSPTFANGLPATDAGPRPTSPPASARC